MQPIIFANPRKFDMATLDSGDWVLPLTNLQDMQPGRVARSTNLTNTFFVAQFPVAVAINVLFLIASNLSPTAQVRLRGATSKANLTAAAGFDSTLLSAWTVAGRPADEGMEAWPVFKQLDNTDAFIWWRVDISDPDNPDGYVEFGRACLAEAIQMAINFTMDWTWSYQPADIVNRTPFGHTLAQARLRPRLFALPFEALTEAEMRRSIGDLQRLRGLAQDICVCIDPDATTFLHDYLVQGLLGDPINFGQPGGMVDVYSGRVSVVELV